MDETQFHGMAESKHAISRSEIQMVTRPRAAEREGQRGQFAPGPHDPGGLIS